MMKTLTLTLAVLATAFASEDFHGKATFYGEGGAGEMGACMLARGFNDVGLTVAINGPMWNDAQNCGKCIKLTGTGFGIGTTPVFGPIYATIDNICPECKYGDIDLGLAGDGRWITTWSFIKCDEARAHGSTLPVKGGPQNNNVRRALQAAMEEAGKEAPAEDLPVAGKYLAPGKYVMPEGIVDMAVVKAMNTVEVVAAPST